MEEIPSVGQLLGEAVLVYEDGQEHRFPIRRRFEVCPPATDLGGTARCWRWRTPNW